MKSMFTALSFSATVTQDFPVEKDGTVYAIFNSNNIFRLFFSVAILETTNWIPTNHCKITRGWSFTWIWNQNSFQAFYFPNFNFCKFFRKFFYGILTVFLRNESLLWVRAKGGNSIASVIEMLRLFTQDILITVGIS